MAVVNITWKDSIGSTITEVDHGTGGNGDVLAEQEISIQHDGTNQITGCKFWIGQYSGSYVGDGR